MAQPQSSRAELVDIALSFLEIAIHGILFYRGVYPPALFQRHRAYGMAVWKSRHPQLNDAIYRVLHSLHDPLMKGAVEAVCVAILDEHGSAVEQYSLDMSFSAPDVVATYSDLETMLAAAVTKLALLDLKLPRLGQDCSFTVLARSHEVLAGPHNPPPDAASAGHAQHGSSKRRAVPGVDGGPSQVLRPGGPWIRVDPGDPEAILDTTYAKGGSVAAPGVVGSGGGRGGAGLPLPSSAASGVPPPAVEVIKTVHAGPLYMRLSVAAASAPEGGLG
jgi:hypothetical protein